MRRRILCLLGWHDIERNDLSPFGYLRAAYCRRPGCDW